MTLFMAPFLCGDELLGNGFPESMQKLQKQSLYGLRRNPGQDGARRMLEAVADKTTMNAVTVIHGYPRTLLRHGPCGHGLLKIKTQ
jgi:hypothetical protein